MLDLKVLTIEDILPVSKVSVFSSDPLTLEVGGHTFNRATRVIINDSNTTDFIVQSNNLIYVAVPEAEKSVALTKLSVLAEAPSPGETSLLKFNLGSIKSITGLQKLVQIFCKLLMQSPGSDRFNPTVGGGLLSVVGRTIDKQGSNVQAAAVDAVSRTKDQLVEMQNLNNRIPEDERLLNASVEGIGYDKGTTTLLLRVFLSAVSGKQAVANLTF